MGRWLSQATRHRYTPNVNSLWNRIVDTTKKAMLKTVGPLAVLKTVVDEGPP